MAGQFDKLIADAHERHKQKPPEEKVSMDFSTNPAVNLNYAKNMIINNIDNLSDRELYDHLKKSYSILLKDIFENEDTSYLDVIISSRLLSQFITLINDVELTAVEIVYCNKLAYDYLVRSEKDDYIKNLLLSMAKAVNRDTITSLYSIGLSDDISSFIALARRSSMKEYVNIRRVNHLIIAYGSDIMTPQMIIYIFEKLFDRFTDLFSATMYDVYDRDTLHNMGSSASEAYSNTNLSLCAMLEGLDSGVIRKVLMTYAANFNMSNEYSEVRFPIQSISVSDYPRILQVVERLKVQEMIVVP